MRSCLNMLTPLRPFFPILYQGSNRRDSYFEGWYFKSSTKTSVSSSGRARTVSFIPGISRSRAGDHAFVQMIDGASGKTRYFSFPVSEFSAKDNPFQVCIGSNSFSFSGLKAELKDEEGTVSAELDFGRMTPPRRSILKPGVMGPYSFVPFMECYHGIASLDHAVDGFVSFTNAGDGSEERIIFDGGRGYIEKDWGTSMPSCWVWIQTNTFLEAVGPASFFFSLARIPWHRSFFNGFISILFFGGHEYRFASYTGARLELFEVSGRFIRILLADGKTKLEVQVRRNREGFLAAPVDGAMDRRIAESADSSVRVVLKQRHGSVDIPLFDSTSAASGVEVVGDTASLMP